MLILISNLTAVYLNASIEIQLNTICSIFVTSLQLYRKQEQNTIKVVYNCIDI